MSRKFLALCAAAAIFLTHAAAASAASITLPDAGFCFNWTTDFGRGGQCGPVGSSFGFAAGNFPTFPNVTGGVNAHSSAVGPEADLEVILDAVNTRSTADFWAGVSEWVMLAPSDPSNHSLDGLPVDLPVSYFLGADIGSSLDNDHAPSGRATIARVFNNFASPIAEIGIGNGLQEVSGTGTFGAFVGIPVQLAMYTQFDISSGTYNVAASLVADPIFIIPDQYQGILSLELSPGIEQSDTPPAVPEPGSLVLFGTGIAALWCVRSKSAA